MNLTGVKVLIPFAVSDALALLKRNSLIFDTFAIPNYEHLLSHHLKTKEEKSVRAELEYLKQHNLVFQPQVKDDFAENFESNIYQSPNLLLTKLSKHKKTLDEIKRLNIASIIQKIEIDSSYDKKGAYPLLLDKNEQKQVKTAISLKNKLKNLSKYRPLKRILPNNENSYDEATEIWFDIETRLKSLEMELFSETQIFPLISNSIIFSERESSKRTADVAQIVLEAIPIPEATVSWEQIFEFRSDVDSKSKFLALRNWINETARGELPANEIEDKLEYLLDQYEKHMKFHKMKYHKRILETLVTTTAEVAENLVKLKFSKITQLLFTLRYKKLALLEEEMNAPGKEIAYISKARAKFS